MLKRISIAFTSTRPVILVLAVLSQVTSCILILSGQGSESDHYVFVLSSGYILLVVGCLLMLMSEISISNGTDVPEEHLEQEIYENLAVFYAILMLGWGGVAIYFKLPLAGSMAILAFVMECTVIVYFFNLKKEYQKYIGTVTACIILTVYCLIVALSPSLSEFVRVFFPGMFWIGASIMLVGLSLFSNAACLCWTYEAPDNVYEVMQMVAIFGAVCAFTVGTVLHIDPLVGLVAIFATAYLVAKLFEVSRSMRIVLLFVLVPLGWVVYSYANELLSAPLPM